MCDQIELYSKSQIARNFWAIFIIWLKRSVIVWTNVISLRNLHCVKSVNCDRDDVFAGHHSDVARRSPPRDADRTRNDVSAVGRRNSFEKTELQRQK